ncbi:MAG: hypothetical protein LBK13_06330 [Spirochaetales bacterium]|jgi:hypothetical protein|nr:hypothetical protein [Spirochaetales bacterium]
MKSIGIIALYLTFLSTGTFLIAEEKNGNIQTYTTTLINSYNIMNDDYDGIDENSRHKINYLKNRGYSQTNIIPDVFFNEIYRLVYETNSQGGYLQTNYSNEGITYILIYALDKPDNPNLYSCVTFSVNGKHYWFLKINFLLEWTTIEVRRHEGNGTILIKRMFY